MVTHSKTCITGKWTETWVFNLSRETKTDRKTHRWTTKSLWPHVLASPISDAQHFANTANVTLRNLGLGPWLGGRGARFLLSCLPGFSYLFLNPWSPFFFFFIGIICMMTPSGTLCVWSLLKLSFGTCPSSPCSYASASSRFSWWSFIFSTASWVFSAAFVTSDRECPFTRESFPQNRPWISSAEWIINKLSF